MSDNHIPSLDCNSMVEATLDQITIRDTSGEKHTIMIASLPLPVDHWVYDTSAEDPVSPFADHPIVKDPEFQRWAKECARHAIRGATMCGKDTDFDPDALVLNMLYYLRGSRSVQEVTSTTEGDKGPADAEPER